MSSRYILFGLLGVVAISAAVLSFAALRDLALLCGFSPWLAPILPVTIDAGATAGAVAWLGRHTGPGRAFGRALALVLLTTSVAGNALGHALAAYAARPGWLVVVAVSAVAPAVLGAVVHLAVLVGRIDHPKEPGSSLAPAADAPSPLVPAEATPPGDEPPDRAAELIAAGAGRRVLARELQIPEHKARELLESRRNGGGS